MNPYDPFAEETTPADAPVLPVLPRQLQLHRLLSTDPDPYDYVLPGLPVSRVGLLVAPGGTGKSRLMLEWAVGVALGKSWPWPPELQPERAPARVVLLAGEDDQQDIHVRLAAISDHLKLTEDEKWLLAWNLDIRLIPGWHFVEALAEGQLPGALLQAIGRTRPRLILADPLARTASYEEVDTRQATHLVEVLERLARASGAAIVVAHHVSKASMRDGELKEQHAARGAAALTDGVRWQQYLVEVSEKKAEEAGIPEDERKFWRIVGNSKANYSAPIADAWLRLVGAGVLAPQGPPTPVGAAGWVPPAMTGRNGGGQRDLDLF